MDIEVNYKNKNRRAVDQPHYKALALILSDSIKVIRHNKHSVTANHVAEQVHASYVLPAECNNQKCDQSTDNIIGI